MTYSKYITNMMRCIGFPVIALHCIALDGVVLFMYATNCITECKWMQYLSSLAWLENAVRLALGGDNFESISPGQGSQAAGSPPDFRGEVIDERRERERERVRTAIDVRKTSGVYGQPSTSYCSHV